jgi:hypothetical protein
MGGGGQQMVRLCLLACHASCGCSPAPRKSPGQIHKSLAGASGAGAIAGAGRSPHRICDGCVIWLTCSTLDRCLACRCCRGGGGGGGGGGGKEVVSKGCHGQLERSAAPCASQASLPGTSPARRREQQPQQVAGLPAGPHRSHRQRRGSSPPRRPRQRPAPPAAAPQRPAACPHALAAGPWLRQRQPGS